MEYRISQRVFASRKFFRSVSGQFDVVLVEESSKKTKMSTIWLMLPSIVTYIDIVTFKEFDKSNGVGDSAAISSSSSANIFGKRNFCFLQYM